jgi:hypothetical protein
MSIRGWSRHAAVLALLSLACACGGGGGGDGGGGGNNPPPGPPPPPAADWYVSETLGSDGAAGTAGEPFRTITHACTQATSGQSIYVFPGTYSTAIGESFPIIVPPGVTVFGDETNKGNGATPTLITGSGLVPLPNTSLDRLAAVVPQAGATVAGFQIVNPYTAGDPREYAVYLQAASVTIRNNQILNSDSGIVFFSGFGNQVVTGNVIQAHAEVGMFFVENSGVGARIENNVITLNQYGVKYDSQGGDLGGGAAASVGGNTISCNMLNDLWTNTFPLTINAANNLWDHDPQTLGENGGLDIYNGAGATIVTTGATVAPGACP